MCLHEAAAVPQAGVLKELRLETCYQIAACIVHRSPSGSGVLRSCFRCLLGRRSKTWNSVLVRNVWDVSNDASQSPHEVWG